MKVLFVGHTDNSLSQIATSYNKLAYLVTSDNYNEFLSSNSAIGFTSLGDMPKDTNIFYNLLMSCDEIFYSPPDEWKKASEKNDLYSVDTDSVQGLTESLILIASRHKKIHGLEFISFHHCTLDMNHHENEERHKEFSFKRTNNDQYLWVTGCSNTLGTGVNIEDTYAYNLHKKLQIPYCNLAMQGASIPWSADKLLRSDIRSGDIVVWGLTIPERINWIENNKIIKFTYTHYKRDKHLEKKLPQHHLVSENTFHQALIGIEQVANFCHKIQAHLVVFSTFSFDYNFYKFLRNKSYFLDMDLDFSINKDTANWENNYIDFGTDNIHPGPKQHHYWHTQILKQINSTQG